MFFLASFLWFVRETKAILFWVYLWQLKEYRFPRFLDHFRTEKGKNIFFNKIFGLKVIFIIAFFIYQPLLPYFLLVLYLLESAKAFKDFFQKKLKKPVITQKTFLLISVALVLAILFLFVLFQFINEIIWFSFWLLVFDILTPIIISLVIFFFQPLAILAKNRIIKKAKAKRAKFKDLLVIGITGSYGKTSVKEFLAEILSENFRVLKTKEHQNTEIGVSRCILNDLKEEHQIFICEMGAYKRGEIKLLCDITKPLIGILTGINEQHLATFGSMGNIIKTKYELIESLPKSGIAIFNGDNEHCFRSYQHTKKSKRFYSLQSTISHLKPDIWVSSSAINRDFLSFEAFDRKGETAVFKVNLLGIQNLLNVLGAICCVSELGISLGEIAKGCRRIKPEQGAMKLIQGKVNIIDSTYSANPDGVISHLEYLKIWPSKKIIVMPSLIELGSASKEIHQEIGRKIGEVCDLAIITTKEHFKEIKDLEYLSKRRTKVLFIEDPVEIFKKIKSFCLTPKILARNGNFKDVILLEGRVPHQLISLLTE